MSRSPLSRWRVVTTCSRSTRVTVPGMTDLSTFGAMVDCPWVLGVALRGPGLAYILGLKDLEISEQGSRKHSAGEEVVL